MDAHIKFIGTIHSDLKRLEDCPLQEHESAPQAVIEIYPSLLEGKNEITDHSELILFTWLHQADRNVLQTRPRNNPEAPLTSVFSTRSPDRPNPIGIHFVKVISVLGENKYRVSGLEVLDGTPLIDIKPDLKNN